ncbi:MAG: flagellar biosynthesis anti-sigma factor FlgM [Porticoccaceae bacterium]|jgi:negative regulator of flagellin synthesis FlgM
MTDSISQLGKTSVRPDTPVDTAKRQSTDKAAPTPSAETSPATQTDQVVLSSPVESALAAAEFDSDKVARIKAAIESGNYPLDENRIAESFLAVEKMLGDS